MGDGKSQFRSLPVVRPFTVWSNPCRNQIGSRLVLVSPGAPSWLVYQGGALLTVFRERTHSRYRLVSGNHRGKGRSFQRKVLAVSININQLKRVSGAMGYL
jgi:hypothetical protein